MKRILLFTLLLSFLLAGCAPSTFIFNNGRRAYYFGSESKGAYKLLCESGDLKKILRDAELSEEIKKDFYEYACSEHRSNERVISLYTFLTPEEKKSLMKSFARHHYKINAVAC